MALITGASSGIGEGFAKELPDSTGLMLVARNAARLSEYVRLAKAGETVLVTERDEVVAELRPAGRRVPVGERLEESLEVLAATGEISRAAEPKGDWTWRSRGLGLPGGAAQTVLDELRQERG